MKNKSVYLLVLIMFLFQTNGFSQKADTLLSPQSWWFSYGVRSTMSTFDGDGTGIGAGGQCRIRINNKINTDWFGDYISINVFNKVRSEYYHIGWSVLYYPFKEAHYPRLLQPYILAGHCFDYNKKTEMADPTNSKFRWGSAVQAGLGTHFNLSNKFDISLTCQYMIHLTDELDEEIVGDKVTILEKGGNILQGHLLTTVSFNYKLFRL